jgi:transaldolase
MILSGELQRMIEQDGIRGVTSNPVIFAKAIAENPEYNHDIHILTRHGESIEEVYQTLTVEDVQLAADQFRPLYEISDGRHGFVSLEVNPHLAHDIDGTVEEAHRLWAALARPNVMIKVPATDEGLTCIEQLIGEGLNINVTLLFGLSRYREVAEAYLRGLESRAADGASLSRIASVASFFLGRIDVQLDPILKNIKRDWMPGADIAGRIYGQVAIASAKRAYVLYREFFESDRFEPLLEKGARPQRLLWASTSTKEQEFSDIKYVEALIGPNTVNTLPRQTLEAYRDHGQPEQRLTQGLEAAARVLDSLPGLDISIDQVARQLEEKGLDRFIKAYDSLMESLRESV